MVGLPTDVIRHYVRTRGILRGIRQWGKRAYLRRTTDHTGENIFCENWDVLVILDACRPDLLREVSSEYTWINEVQTRNSVGTATLHWMENTFNNADQSVLEDTIYISGNPFTEHILEESNFAVLEEVWKWGWSDELGTVPPRTVTDAGIDLSRERQPERLIIHYMQPHTPFLGSSSSPDLTLENFTGRGDRPLDDWELIEMDERSISGVWEDYRENLRRVLDDVSLLRENINADKMIITSDHGNAVGEHGLYGHPGGVSIPALYQVPWCETDAVDRRTHEPTEYQTGTSSDDIESKLNALGYL